MSEVTTDDCCPQPALSRRGFLRGAGVAAGAGLLALTTPGTATSLAFADSPATGGDVLVVLSLRGGFDGLSAIAPIGDPAYAKARPSLAVPVSKAIALDRTFGLHPALGALKPFWDAGTFGAIHAVGQPSGSRSHFAASDELDRAAPGTSVRSGWLNRTLAGLGAGLTPAQDALRGVYLGSAATPPLLSGDEPTVSVAGLKGFRMIGDPALLAKQKAALAALWPDPDSPEAGTLSVLQTLQGVSDKATGPQNGARYPATELGAALADLARIIKAKVGLRVATIDFGDWDMHTGMGTVAAGRMNDHLAELGQALAAFAMDLGPAAMQAVSLVTLSEFGRRVAENASSGTDHGHGNAVLFLGGGLVGGKVHGSWPTLAPGKLDSGDLAGTTDYRDVLAEVLTKRLGAAAIGEIFPGFRPSPLGMARQR